MELPKGAYDFRLARPARPGATNAQAFHLSADSRVEAILESRRISRIIGGSFLGAGLTAGIPSLVIGTILRNEERSRCAEARALTSGELTSCQRPGNDGIAGIAIGTALMAAAALVGALLIRKDKLHLRVSPPAPGSPAALSEPLPSEEPRSPELRELDLQALVR